MRSRIAVLLAALGLVFGALSCGGMEMEDQEEQEEQQEQDDD
jgi:hypothetical protein